jgi:hypothetical protein
VRQHAPVENSAENESATVAAAAEANKPTGGSSVENELTDIDAARTDTTGTDTSTDKLGKWQKFTDAASDAPYWFNHVTGEKEFMKYPEDLYYRTYSDGYRIHKRKKKIDDSLYRKLM